MYKNSCFLCFQLSPVPRKPPSLKVLLDPSNIGLLVQFFVCFQSFTERKRFASSLLRCSTYFWAELLLAAQAILPIATHYSVAWSVCRLSHSCTLLKPFDSVRCHLTGTLQHLWGPSVEVLMGFLFPRVRGDLGSNPQPKHAIANCCCHFANRNEDSAIPPFTKLLWSCYFSSRG